MIFLDRLTGGKLSRLPDALLPGRYCLLEPLVVNGHSRLQPGDLLSDDGSGVIRIQDTESQVLAIDQTDEDQADADLSAEAIISIAGKIAHAHDANVSPMLPAEMAAQVALEEVERDLAAVLRDGHLHSISDRPRRDLRYDDLVAPVARARRLATSALSHLASHSDCWQQRTLSGVQPRKVLARFSEDDYAIYENRLYKRLLDRLDRHLARRLARIRGVNSRLERALELQDSEQTHFRLRQDICRLWGESYLDDKTGMQLEAGKRALSDLESQLRAIRGLKQRGLYSLVPPASVVPAQIHRTNILNHDPHYRHLPPLWEKLKDDREDRLLPPEERLARQLQLQTPLPVAHFTAALDGLDHGHNWLRADPVHLQVNMDQLLLVPGSALQISAEDADALTTALNRHFAEDGLQFVAPHPNRWYVRLTHTAAVTHTPLDQVAGQNINDFLPQGADAMRWHQWLNEIQMLLYTHPANDAREQQGLPLIHSVWFWGEGTPQPGVMEGIRVRPAS